MRDKKYNQKIGIFLLVVFCFVVLYFCSVHTYMSYESTVDGALSADVAGIHIAIDGKDILSKDLKDGVTLDNINWDVSHTREGKVAPGAVGNVTFTLDPKDSDVAFMYTFTINDKQSGLEKLLKFNNFSSDNGNLIKTGENEYTGLVTLNDINNGKVINITMGFEFSNEDIEGSGFDDSNLDNYFSIDFKAIQYNGEKIG